MGTQKVDVEIRYVDTGEIVKGKNTTNVYELVGEDRVAYEVDSM